MLYAVVRCRTIRWCPFTCSHAYVQSICACYTAHFALLLFHSLFVYGIGRNTLVVHIGSAKPHNAQWILNMVCNCTYDRSAILCARAWLSFWCDTNTLHIFINWNLIVEWWVALSSAHTLISHTAHFMHDDNETTKSAFGPHTRHAYSSRRTHMTIIMRIPQWKQHPLGPVDWRVCVCTRASCGTTNKHIYIYIYILQL